MKSIKPGRGPSAMSAVGGVFGVVFGIFWTIIAFAVTRNSPIPVVGVIFPLFGVIFVVVGIANVVYNLYNAAAEDRMSVVDVVTDEEEPDPLNEMFGRNREEPAERPPIAPVAPGAPIGSAADDSVESRLAKLAQLKSKGLISEEEYLEQRQRVLNEI